MRTTELDLSPAAHLCLEVADIHEVDLESHNGTEGQLLLIEQPDEYDSCVGRVHIAPASARR
jgi:hypothetical protein